MAKLNKTSLKSKIKEPGWHGDGGGLYFRVEDGEKAYWVYRYQGPDGKRHAMSLGTYPELHLDEARDRHVPERAKVKAYKIDPLAERRAARQINASARVKPTFGEVADDHLRAHQDSRKNDRHRRQWFVALTTEAVRKPREFLQTIAQSEIFRDFFASKRSEGSKK
jgi:hypothetical protein